MNKYTSAFFIGVNLETPEYDVVGLACGALELKVAVTLHYVSMTEVRRSHIAWIQMYTYQTREWKWTMIGHGSAVEKIGYACYCDTGLLKERLGSVFTPPASNNNKALVCKRGIGTVNILDDRLIERPSRTQPEFAVLPK